MNPEVVKFINDNQFASGVGLGLIAVVFMLAIVASFGLCEEIDKLKKKNIKLERKLREHRTN